MNNQQLRDLFADDDIASSLYETGYRKVLSAITVDDKDDISNIFSTYHTVIKVKAEIDQFVVGLQCIKGLCKYIKRFPSLMRPLFVHDNSKELTAGNQLTSCIFNCLIKFGLFSSRLRTCRLY